jgi:6-phosphofructokinase 2
VYAAGGLPGDRLEELLGNGGLRGHRVRIAGSTRQSFAVHERETGRQFRFLLPGPELEHAEWTACVRAVEALLVPEALLLVSGSIPPGVPPEALGRIAALGRERGARVLVDVAGEPMREALRAGVFMARFNRPELDEFAGRPLPDVDERHDVIAALVDDGRAEVAIATVGGDGALVAAPGLRLRIRPPVVVERSPVGAGDSLMGAITLALARGWDLERACRLGVAAAAGAHMTPGTALCRREDVERLYDQTTEWVPG